MAERKMKMEKTIREMFAEDCYRYCTKELCIKDIARRLDMPISYIRKVVKGF